MAILKNKKTNELVFVKGQLLLKKKNRKIDFYAKEKGSNPRETGG